MSDTKEFPTLDVVTVATGTMVSDQGIGSVYKVCGWMLDDELMTHQLPNASRTLEPHILHEHPWILLWDLPKDDLPALKAMCARIVEEHGETVTLTRPESVDWVTGNALPDLRQIVGKRRVMQVDIDEDGNARVADTGSGRVRVDASGLVQAIETISTSGAEAVDAFERLAEVLRDGEEDA